MKNKIIAISGIAGSGKTYLAKKLSLDKFRFIIAINEDDVRQK